MKSKAEIIRGLYLSGKITNSPEDKKKMAAELGITVQTVHATLVKMNKPPYKTLPTTEGLDIRDLVEKKFNRCYEIAAEAGTVLPKIEIDFSLRGDCAGQFVRKYDFVNGTKKYFRINLELAKHNVEDYLNETVPHEFCHYIVAAKYGKVSPHGWEWKNAMRDYFMLEPRRCHSYDISLSNHRQMYHYKCKCREKIMLGAIRHRKMQMNNKTYHCTLCNSKLEFMGEKA